MSALLNHDCLPSEVGDSDTYNRIQMRRAVLSRGDPNAEPAAADGDELLRVLIVDDNHALADTTSKLVGIWGHDVRQAYDGRTALSLANAYQPDVLLLDLVMLETSGLEVSRSVRQQDHLRSCFIVAVTGCTEARLWPLCRNAGIDLILVKPVVPSILRALLTWEAQYVLRSQHESVSDAKTATLSTLSCQQALEVSRAVD